MSSTESSLPKPRIVAVDGKKAAHVYFMDGVRYPLLPGVQSKIDGVGPLLDQLAFLYQDAPKEDHAEYALQMVEFMFDKAALDARLEEPSFDEPKVLAALEAAISRCRRALTGPFLHVFILPRFNAESAVNGHNAGDNVIFLYVNPGAEWEKTLTLIFAHEYFHLASPSHVRTVADHIVDEGLSVLFSEEVSDQKDSDFPTMTIDEARVWLGKIRSRLDEPLDIRNRKEVIRGVAYGKAHLGYSLGYSICREALRTLHLAGWPEIAHMRAAEIFRAGERAISADRNNLNEESDRGPEKPPVK